MKAHLVVPGPEKLCFLDEGLLVVELLQLEQQLVGLVELQKDEICFDDQRKNPRIRQPRFQGIKNRKKI